MVYHSRPWIVSRSWVPILREIVSDRCPTEAGSFRQTPYATNVRFLARFLCNWS